MQLADPEYILTHMKKKLVDLSLTISDNMPTYPGDPACNVSFVKKSGCQLATLSMGSHAGTHLDAPRHFIPRGRPVDCLPLEKCAGEAFLVNLSNKKSNSEITVKDLRKHVNFIKKGSKILLRTDWGKHFGTNEYFKNAPGLSIEAAKWLANMRIGLIGLETPSVHPVKSKIIHRILLKKEIVIIEGLANLNKLAPGKLFFCAVPLKIQNSDGSPVRAWAIQK